jgi:hypothetical protein
VVGWKTSHRADTQLVLGALAYALWGRQVERDRLVFHSDPAARTHPARWPATTAPPPIEGRAPASTRRWVNRIAVYCPAMPLDLVRWIDGWYNPTPHPTPARLAEP